ncbi:MAG: NUDIX domain-containing protein [Patescibacteria group bacterium]|jgi:ADP-ribose pyrophosphatase YjhB (NUDIX family)
MKSRSKKFFRFCPHCGGFLEMKNREGRRRLICKKCGYILYQNSVPTVTALILDKRGRILLTRRGIRPKYGCWDLPGGFLENGEDPIAGLKREIREELGATLLKIKYLGVYIDKYFHQSTINTLNLFYEARIGRGTLKALSDISGYRWFEYKKIPMNKIAFKWNKTALKDWRRGR